MPKDSKGARRMRSRAVLIEAFGRLPALVAAAVEGLTPAQLCWAPAVGANTVGWLIWHLTRIQDHHISELREQPQVWQSDGWAARFGLTPDPHNTGYGHDASDVASVRPDDARSLAAYYTAVWERTESFLASVGDEDLDKIVDRRWDPPVTLGVRLVSVLGDDMQHVGQAAYVRGLLPGKPPTDQGRPAGRP